jgi:alkaline phosphatase
MTAAAIGILARNGNGYFLMVEGGRIDHALHDTNARRALTEIIAFDAAVAAAVRLTDARDTLIIVTADHSHAMTLGGYATRGNPILGTVVENDAAGYPRATPALAADGRPYTTLGFAIGPQAGTPRRDLRRIDTTAPDFIQDARVPMKSGSHGGEDVAAYARGPWAHLLHGVQEQNYLYHVMRHATRLSP